MRVGELADQAGVSAQTIRYYEAIGLLQQPERLGNGYRDYSAENLSRLEFIKRAQSSGLSLTQIGSILELKDSGRSTCEHTLMLLRSRIDELTAQISSLSAARADLVELERRSSRLDPADCADPNRCQILAEAAAV